MKRETSAGGVVFRLHAGKPLVLLIKDSYGRWALPKGLVEKDESGEQAAVREVKEETGLQNVQIASRLGEVKYFFKLKGETIFKIVIFFLMKTEEAELHKSWEVQDARWFPAGEAADAVEYKNTREIMKKALAEMTCF